MRTKSILSIFILLIVALVLGACRTSRTETKPSTAKPPSVSTVQVKLNEFSFQPDRIRVKAGEVVQLELVNEGNAEHEFMVGQTVDRHQGQASGFQKDFFAGLKVTSNKVKLVQEHGHATMVKLAPGAKTTLSLTVPAERAGEWEVGCFVIGHYESGMRGSLIVATD